MTVDWQGRVKPCPMISAEKLQLGHWSEIENKSYQRKSRAYSRLKGPKKEVCGDCQYAAYCFNCIARALRASTIVGDCKWKKENRNLIQMIMN